MQINFLISLGVALIYLFSICIAKYKYHKIILIGFLVVFISPFLLGASQQIISIVTLSMITGVVFVEIIKNIIIKFYFRSKNIKKKEEIEQYLEELNEFSLYVIFKKNKDKNNKQKKEDENKVKSENYNSKKFKEQLHSDMLRRKNKKSK